ncbi:MAG: DUF5107 domain-containing protein [Bacteroidales bacterium]|nr:DUF5107 domain-containing protein [Bacteroidales bacterium]
MNRLKAILLTAALFAAVTPAFSQVSITEENWVLPTFRVEAPDRNPMFFKGESYQGASKYIYPYGLNDVIGNERKDHAWKAVVLENEYIKLCVTPEIGGKLYYAADKTNGYNFIYKNDVVKPSNIGMTGAWVSGGIEWCVIHHHRASTFLPVDYDLKENADGSKTVWIGETEPRHRMRWTIGITAYPGKSYYSAEVKILNPTALTNTFLYWANVAAHTNKDYQVIFPPSVNLATYHAKNSFTRWPFSTELYNGEDFTKGVDLSWWVNSENQNSYFAHDLTEDFMGGYDHGRESGTVHVADHNIVKGAKLWEWGSGPRGQATEGRLTEKAGPYVEIMVGAFSDNQPDYSWIKPYEVKSFKQYWFPVKDIKGFKNANLNGAVNLEKGEGNTVFLGYYSTQKVPAARITLKNGERIILDKTVEISPEKTFTASIKIEGPFKMTDLSTSLVNTAGNELLLAYAPVEVQKATGLPDEVKKPPLPAEIKTIEELFLTGSRILQFYNPTLNAMDYFSEALVRDPGDIRTNIAVGKIHLKNSEYALARKYFTRALKRLTKDYTRPSDCEALYLEGLTLRKMKLDDFAIDTLYRATWDQDWHSAAYLELARISCSKGDFERALGQVNESLRTNSVNNSAIALKAAILRRLGDHNAAFLAVNKLYENDPLDFRSGNELYLAVAAGAGMDKAPLLLAKLEKNMRSYSENYLELAAGYINDGLHKEAAEVLLRFRNSNPMISYYLGYLETMNGNASAAGKYFKNASSMPEDYVFPFRDEDVAALDAARMADKSDPKPLYYLGNALYDKQPAAAISCWEEAARLNPSVAIVWRNLGWAYYHHSKDLARAISAYEKAFENERNEAVYYAELDPLYEMDNTPIEKRARLFEGMNDVVKRRDDSFVREIMVLNLAGKSEKSVEYLAGSTFHFREGSSRVRDISVDAHILLGIRYMDEKKYDAALRQFLENVESAEASASGRRIGDTRSPQINYFIGSAYAALGNKSRSRQYFTLSAEQQTRGVNYITYYQALSFMKLGNRQKAEELLGRMIEDGTSRIKRGEEVDFFAKFGEKEAAAVQMSGAYLIRGLGYKGLGDAGAATEDLKKAKELSASSLWAGVELNELNFRP